MTESQLIERMKALRLTLRDLEDKAAIALAAGDDYLVTAICQEMSQLSRQGVELNREWQDLEAMRFEGRAAVQAVEELLGI